MEVLKDFWGSWGLVISRLLGSRAAQPEKVWVAYEYYQLKGMIVDSVLNIDRKQVKFIVTNNQTLTLLQK